ncbi:hypothetical protein THAOC_14508 [Thalassiosira oceanica]|uniref:Uncharacterized protein n=1 Tax=Thalassiosira oceanica TaxID=159749 RepID=K0SIG9_THAOC|nr:hypothetical protein THAOC_14508 [Thalassiosira oceanica]|eukprot:EJK64729.1 hypothetical protein THAOC_14508 [Thalassiosira oceanica]
MSEVPWFARLKTALASSSPNTSPMMCCGRRAIPMALRPPLSIKRAGATANLCIIARARPARGPGAVR